MSLEVFADLDVVEQFTLIEDLQRIQRDKKHEKFLEQNKKGDLIGFSKT